MALGWNSRLLTVPSKAPESSGCLQPPPPLHFRPAFHLSATGSLLPVLSSSFALLPLGWGLNSEGCCHQDSWQSPGHTSHSAFKSKSWNDASPQKFWVLNQGSVWRWFRAWARISGRVQSCMTLCMLFILPEPLLLYLKNGVKRALSGTCEG